MIDEAYAIRPASPLCKEQQGACAGATLPCSKDVYEPKWSQIKSGDAICTDAHYKAHSNDVRRPAPANGEEDRCDNLDNDCDGQVDEGCPWIKMAQVGASRSPRILLSKDAQNKDVVYLALTVDSGFSGTGQFSLDGFAFVVPSSARSLFVGKVDQSGKTLWALEGKRGDTNTSSFDVVCRGMALDPTHRWLYLLADYDTAFQVGNVILRPSDISGSQGSGGGARDIALLKIDTQTGTLVWATNIGEPGADDVRSISSWMRKEISTFRSSLSNCSPSNLPIYG